MAEPSHSGCSLLPDGEKARTAKTETDLFSELRGLIEQARQHVAQAANSTLTQLYWKVGERIGREVLRGQRAEYGEQIVSTLSTQLALEYGEGFGLRSVRRMVQFAEAFPDEDDIRVAESWTRYPT